MAQYADRRHLPYFPEDRPYYSTTPRASQSWAPDAAPRPAPAHHHHHYIPTPASFVAPAWNALHFAQCPQEFAPRQYHTPDAPADAPPSLLDAISLYSPPYTRPASRASASTSDAYTPSYAAPTPASRASPPPTPIKEEQPDDDGFIVALRPAPSPPPHARAPPAAVPLRATQASARMRRMMGVFRLNPFAMHARGGRGVPAPWAGGEARPLEEEPRVFEFQLELAGAAPQKVEDPFGELGLGAAGLRAFSPGFEPGFELEVEGGRRDPEDEREREREREEEAHWELAAYPALSAFDPVAAYPRALHPYTLEGRFAPVPRRWTHPHPHPHDPYAMSLSMPMSM
ncbi:hypothetical protein B0H15DRAFT_998852 [Mycena belliarum]|uniref:Uncharacterized protein n=1 Tax=Mycena belliarum TaxID=1033014 RepID=A0AAD6XW06_9AGAR|nr:hypothetical protein B0H15DRAFT_998852 [Mycena belliae]